MPALPRVQARLPRSFRVFRLALLRLRARWRDRVLLAMVRASTWVYFAAVGVVGFGGMEVLIGAFALAPELLPFMSYPQKSRHLHAIRM